MLARLVLNAVVFQLDQSDLQTKTGAYSLGKCVERIVLTHSREFVWVLPSATGNFWVDPLSNLAGFDICLRLWPSATGNFGVETRCPT